MKNGSYVVGTFVRFWLRRGALGAVAIAALALVTTAPLAPSHAQEGDLTGPPPATAYAGSVTVPLGLGSFCWTDPGAEVGLFDFRQWYEYDHYSLVVASGAVSVAWSAREMGQQILEALTHPERLRAERRALIESFFGDTLDGRSGERVARVVLDLASLAEAPLARQA